MNFILIILFIFVFLPRQAFAAEHQVCISSEQDFIEKKSQLPVVLQDSPLYFIKDSMFGKAAVKLAYVNNKLKISTAVLISEAKFDEAYVEKYCVENKKVTLNFENGKTAEIGISSNKEAKIKGYSLDKVDVDVYEKISKKINYETVKAEKGSVKATSTESGGIR